MEDSLYESRLNGRRCSQGEGGNGEGKRRPQADGRDGGGVEWLALGRLLKNQNNVRDRNVS